MTNPDAVPWVVFHKGNPRRSEIHLSVTRRGAIELGQSSMRISHNYLDAVVVCEGETNEQAKARVAGSVG